MADQPFQLVDNESSSKQGLVMRLASSLSNRLQLARLGSLQFGGARDLYSVFGYKKSLKSEDFLAKYIRQDITARIIDAPPGATWANPPTFTNVSIQTAWDELQVKHNLWGLLSRADRLARLGPYSAIMFGFDDTGSVDQPVRQGGVKELLYARVFSTRMVKEIQLEDDPRNPRFGMPGQYTFEFGDPQDKLLQGTSVLRGKAKNLKVHWSRTVHVVENPLEDSIFGVPIIERIFNVLDDLLKVAGGTSEAYWLTANRGMQADIDPEMDLDPQDAADLSDEIEEYQHQLRRIIRTRGVKINDLGADTPAPQEVFEMLISIISGATGIPRRILVGSEQGELASAQDRANWAERIDERRQQFAEPGLLRPTLNTLQEAGVLPSGDTDIEWPSAFIMSPLEASMVMAQTARAIGNISRQTGGKMPMQLTSREEARDIIGLEGDLPDGDLLETQPPEPVAPPNVGPDGTPGNGPPASGGGNTEEDD